MHGRELRGREAAVWGDGGGGGGSSNGGAMNGAHMIGRDELRLYETVCQRARSLAICRWVLVLLWPGSFTLVEGV